MKPFFPARFFAAVFLAGTSLGGICTLAQAETSAGRIYKSDEVQKAPTPKRDVRIRFSRAQRKEHEEITVRFVVTAQGKIDQLTIVKFSDPEMIDPVFNAYQSAEYTPAMKDGKPVDAWVEVTEVAK